MKILDKTFLTNEDTFEPIMRLTIDVPVEVIEEQSARLEQDEFYKFIGQSLCEAAVEFNTK